MKHKYVVITFMWLIAMLLLASCKQTLETTDPEVDALINSIMIYQEVNGQAPNTLKDVITGTLSAPQGVTFVKYKNEHTGAWKIEWELETGGACIFSYPLSIWSCRPPIADNLREAYNQEQNYDEIFSVTDS